MKCRYKCFDVLKGIAIIMVILVHSRQKIDGLSSSFDFLMFGQMGCQIFFLISGYFTSQSWSNLENTEHKHKRFYTKRFLTIAPCYYLVIFVSQLLNIIARTYGQDIGFATNNNVVGILFNILFLNGLLPFCNNNVAPGGWYIGTLAIYYALFPVIFAFSRKLKRKRVAMPIVSILLVYLVILMLIRVLGSPDFFLGNNTFIYFSFPVQFPCFVLGVQLWFERKQTTVNKYMSYSLTIGCIILAMWMFFGNVSKYSFIFIPTIFSYGFYFLLRNLLRRETIDRGEDTFMSDLGKKSFYVYLSHGLFVWTMPKAIQTCLRYSSVEINPDLLYLLMLPFMFGFSCALGGTLERYHNSVLKYINRIGTRMNVMK